MALSFLMAVGLLKTFETKIQYNFCVCVHLNVIRLKSD